MDISALIIDDEIEYGELLAEIADLNEVKAIFTDNPNELETLVEEHPNIQLIFLDLSMPQRDGIEVLRALDVCKYKGEVVVMSGFDESVLNTAFELAKSLKLNLIDPIQKPFDIQKISGIFNKIKKSVAAYKEIPTLKKKCTLLTFEQTLEALQENRVELYFQPQVSATSEKIIGVESLVRFRDREGNIIFPDRFIPVIEKHHLTQLLLEKVIDEVCRKAEQVFAKFADITLSINISALDLNRLSLPEEFTKKFSAANIPPARINIELTESQAVSYNTITLDILTRLRLKGFHLSIDDFGTGSSVLENIKKIPFTELKVDKTFIDQIENQPRSLNLLKDIITMAHNQNMQVVVEGVEDIDTLKVVQEAGTDIIQGYLYAKPMAVYEFLNWQPKKNKSDKFSLDFYVI